ncbi:uncharacterized protein PHACADRAFT_108439, partial [Phanerochaete carnosa HHB-10118-sp]
SAFSALRVCALSNQNYALAIIVLILSLGPAITNAVSTMLVRTLGPSHLAPMSLQVLHSSCLHEILTSTGWCMYRNS